MSFNAIRGGCDDVSTSTSRNWWLLRIIRPFRDPSFVRRIAYGFVRGLSKEGSSSLVDDRTIDSNLSRKQGLRFLRSQSREIKLPVNRSSINAKLKKFLPIAISCRRVTRLSSNTGCNCFSIISRFNLMRAFFGSEYSVLSDSFFTKKEY